MVDRSKPCRQARHADNSEYQDGKKPEYDAHAKKHEPQTLKQQIGIHAPSPQYHFLNAIWRGTVTATINYFHRRAD